MRLVPDPGSFRNHHQLVFGIGGAESELNEEHREEFCSVVDLLLRTRQPNGPQNHPLWRLHPERWLESLIIQDVTQIDERLQPTPVYSQVPAFSASDRAMIDVLGVTRQGRLAVLELKADEDVQLPLQGLDYWARVCWHHARGEFEQFGYFPERGLAPDPPLLIYVAPALHVHPATDTLLRYFSPAIEWMVVGIDEHWREAVRVVFRKRPQDIGGRLGKQVAAAS